MATNHKTPRKALTLAEMGYGNNKVKSEEKAVGRGMPRAKRMADILEQINSNAKPQSSRKPLKNLNHIQNHYLSTSKKNATRRQTTAACNIRRAITFSCTKNNVPKVDLNTLSDVVTFKNPPSMATRSSLFSQKQVAFDSFTEMALPKKITHPSTKENVNPKKLSIITEDSSRDSSTLKNGSDSGKRRSYRSLKNINESLDSLPETSFQLNQGDRSQDDTKNSDTDVSLSTSLCRMLNNVKLERKLSENIKKDIDEISQKVENSIKSIELQMSLLSKDLDNQKSILNTINMLKDNLNNVNVEPEPKLRSARKSLNKNFSKSDSNLCTTSVKSETKKRPNVVFKTPNLTQKVSRIVPDVSESGSSSIGLRVKVLRANTERATTMSSSKETTPKKANDFYSTIKKSMKFLKTPTVDTKDKNPASKAQTPGTKLSRNVQRQLSILYDP